MSENAEKEPTMEEILSSIRRIISEEDEEPAAGAEAADAADDDGDDILDLTDEPAQPARAPAPAAVQAMPADDDDDILVLDHDDVVDPEQLSAAGPAPEPRAEMARVAPAPPPAPVAAMAGIGERAAESGAPGAGSMDWGHEEGAMTNKLVGESAASAAAGAFARLQRSARVPESSDDKSLETIVRELLRPMLKDWLDANLPGIVEKHVREEVERIARQA
jgi:hypothetical protein